MPAREGLFVPYDGVQGTSPTDARVALGGLLAVQGATTRDIRPGILYGPGDAAGSAAAEPGKVTGTTSTAPWRYSIRAAHLVGLRTADLGPYLFTVEGTSFADTVAAPASGSRWDLIWSRQKDSGQGDSSSLAEVGVTRGAAAASSPVKPYAPGTGVGGDLPVGAVVLAEALVASTATNTASAGVTITMVAPFTTLRGCPVPVRSEAERDALTAHPGLEVIRLDRQGAQQRFDRGSWDNEWVNLTLGSNWSAYTATDRPTPRARRVGSMIEVEGEIVRGAAAGAVLATFPVGMRPTKLLTYATHIASDLAVYALQVNPAGQLIFSYATASVGTARVVPLGGRFGLET